MFHCAVVGGELITSDESRAIAWLTPDEIRDRMTDAYAVRLLDALTDGPVPIRAHDGTTVTTPL